MPTRWCSRRRRWIRTSRSARRSRKNGNIYNVWTLNLKTNELKQYTDALGGNVSPVVLRDESKAQRIAFITYYKGEYGIHTVPAQKEALHTVATADFGAPGPIIDFQPPLSHTLVKGNQRVKGRFEKLFLEGRPPVNVGVTSGGDFFGGTQVTFTDVLGDQQFNFYAESVSQYRSLSLSYLNLSRRFQYALQGFSQTQFYYANNAGTFYAAQYGFLSHDDALSTQTSRGGTAFGIYPLNRYARLELTGGLIQFKQGYNDPNLQQAADDYQQRGLRAEPVRQRQPACRSARPTSARRPCSASTARSRATRCALGYEIRAEDRQLHLAADLRRRRAQVHPPRDQRRAGVPVPRPQELGGLSRPTSTPEATRSCAATSTSSSSATSRSSPTRSCGSRSSKRR